MTDTMSIPDRYVETLNRVMQLTRDLLESAEGTERSEEFIGAVDDYLNESTTAELTFVRRDEVAADDRFALDGARERLFWTTVGDLVVFRCVGLYEFWCAVQGADVPNREEVIIPLSELLLDEWSETQESLVVSVLPRVAGGQGPLPTLEELVLDDMRKIANGSVSNVLGAAFTALGGLLPHTTPGPVVRAIRRVGRVLHLDRLLHIARELLDLALRKLSHIFGPGFETVVDQLREWLEDLLGIKDRIADSMFRTSQLERRLKVEIEAIVGPGQDASTYRAKVDEVYERFKQWDDGFDIANMSVKWGRRLSTVAPPVRVALESLRIVLMAGAFLIGQYNLDSPTLALSLPWQTDGLLSALR